MAGRAIYKVAVPVDELQKGMVMAQTFHIKNAEGVNLMFSWVGTRLSKRHIEVLRSYQVSELMIFTDVPPPKQPRSRDAVRSYAELMQELTAEKKKTQSKNVSSIPMVEPVVPNNLRDEAIEGIKNLFTSTRESVESGRSLVTAYQHIKKLDGVVYSLVHSILFNSKECVHLSNLKSYDEYTYHHSLSVAVLSVAIGQALGLDSKELKNLCRCAILHDIGKVLMPIELITKPGRLNKDEFELIKTHAKEGGHYLKTGTIGNMDLWLGVMYHHEHVDGTGYPRQLKNNEIPLFSRIIAVADVYDAVTSFRPYRSPMIPGDALEMIMSQAGTAYDYDVVNALNQKLELYPINTIVSLSNKRAGIVVDNSNAKRPIIHMLDNGEVVDLSALNNLNLIIIKID